MYGMQLVNRQRQSKRYMYKLVMIVQCTADMAYHSRWVHVHVHVCGEHTAFKVRIRDGVLAFVTTE